MQKKARKSVKENWSKEVWSLPESRTHPLQLR